MINFDLITTSFIGLVAVSGIVERTTELIKVIIQNDFKRTLTPSQKQILSVTVGVIICSTTGVVLYNELPILPVVNTILAGMAVSLGSNVLHTIISIVLAFKEGLEQANK